MEMSDAATVEKGLTEEFERGQTEDASDTEQRQRDLADFYGKQHKFEQEEQMYEQVLVRFYQKHGLDDPRTIQSRHDLAKLYEDHGKAGEAERIYREALAICKGSWSLGVLI